MRGIRKFLALCALVVSFGALATVNPALARPVPGGPGGPPDNPGLTQKAEREGSVRVIVQLTDRRHQSEVAGVVSGGHGRVNVSYRRFPLLALTVDSHALRGLQRSPRVVGIQEDVARPPALDSSLPVINADDVQDLGWTGTGSAVAILDTGIDVDHPFFGSRIVAQACFSNAGGGGSGVSLCPNGNNSQTGAGAADSETAQCLNMGAQICDHGPHVAGIAAGAATGVTGAPGDGVAPGANIIAIQVFTRFNTTGDGGCGTSAAPCVRTYDSDQILGLQEVLDLDAANNVAAANMSLGGGEHSSACDGDARKTAVDALLAAGVATVIAAGNNGFLNSVGNPACISTAVTVGSVYDNDTVRETSNRGPLLDLFAPGTSINSSVPDDTFGVKGGTSMAAPHVAGAFAMLREAYPSATIAQLLGYMQSTGVPITYATNADGTTQATTPRLDLLAALQAGNNPPALTADQATVSIPEGSTATNTGTFNDPDGNPVTLTASVGTVTATGPGTWSWSYGTNDGPPQSQMVTITGTDDKSESGSVTFALTVNNVPPTVAMDAAQATTLNEGDVLQVGAHFTDPGWADTYSGQIDWGTGATSPGALVVTVQGPPADQGDVTGSHQYGDDGTFTVQVSVTDDDAGTGSASFALNVANVAPTAAIDDSGFTSINGVPTVIAHAGEPVQLSGRSTDPGSDDLALSWDWDDGAPAPDVTTPYLANPPGTDPDPSPSVQPRDVTDSQTHTFGGACLYDVGFAAADDDGGSASDTAKVIIAGNAEFMRGAGYWEHQFRGNGRTALSTAQRECYLAIAGHMSQVFDEVRDASTMAKAKDVLWVNMNLGTMEEIFDRALLAAWLNFANGAVDLGQLVDTDGDGVVDTDFGSVIAAAEAVRLDPNHTRSALESQKNILERINGTF